MSTALSNIGKTFCLLGFALLVSGVAWAVIEWIVNESSRAIFGVIGFIGLAIPMLLLGSILVLISWLLTKVFEGEAPTDAN